MLLQDGLSQAAAEIAQWTRCVKANAVDQARLVGRVNQIRYPCVHLDVRPARRGAIVIETYVCLEFCMKKLIVTAIVAMTPVLLLPITRIMDGEKIGVRPLIGALIAVAGVIGLTVW